MNVMWAIPNTPRRPASAWAPGDERAEWRTALLEDVSVVDIPVATASLEDPPWINETEWEGGGTTGDTVGGCTADGDCRQRPPTTGLAQRATTVQLVKQGGVYTVVLDGVAVDGGETRKFWLPRFREEEAPPGAEEEPPRVVGPLTIALRLEEDEVAPTRATVRVLQSIEDVGTTVMRRQLAVELPLKAHGVGDLLAPYVLLPYPAAVTRQPFVTIVDRGMQRRWDNARAKWEGSRTWTILNQFAAQGNANDPRQRWQLALFRVSSTLSDALSTVMDIKQLDLDGYAAKRRAPTNNRTYEYSIGELTLALRRIAETRADGTTPSLRFGVVATRLTDAGYRKDAALLQWLSNGESSNGSNILDATGLDAQFVSGTRVEYAVQIVVEEPNGSELVYEFESLRANAVDAGFVMLDVPGQLRRLRKAADDVRGKLGDKDGWLASLLFLVDADRVDANAFSERLDRLVGVVKAQSGAGGVDDEITNAINNPGILATIIGGKLTDEKYQARLGMLQRRYAAAMGVELTTTDAATGITGTELKTSSGFWRWVEHNLPIFGLRLGYEALSAFSVDKPDRDWADRRVRPALVRRLPGIGIDSSRGRATLLRVLPVPDETFSERAGAKRAVEAARECWRRTTELYRRIHWTVEATGGFGEPSTAFHFLQCYAAADADAVDGLPRLRRAETSTDVLCLSVRPPDSIDAEEALANQFVSAADAWALRAAAGTRRAGDAAVLRDFGLTETRESMAALEAYAAIVAHRATAHAARLTRADLVWSCVREAQDVARAVAAMAETLYGATTKQQALLSREDLAFACLPHGDDTRCALARVGVWQQAQRAQQTRRETLSEFHREWPMVHRQSVTLFARALRALASSRLPPTAIPVTALQCLWYSDNPVVERLLIDEPVATDGFELQLGAAMASFQRVRGLLRDATWAAHAALASAVGARPVALVAWQPEHDRARVQRALQSGATRDALVTPDPADADPTLLLVRCAALRIDTVADARDEPVSNKESVDALADRLGAIAVSGVARYVVPSGATLHAATTQDLGNASALEDTPVWSASVVRAIDRLVAWPTPATAETLVVEAAEAVVEGRARHPHLIEGSATGWRLRLHAMPALPAPVDADTEAEAGPLPTTVYDALVAMEARGDRTRALPSRTWTLQARLRSLVWNVDRVVQLLLLLQAERWTDRAGGAPPHAPYAPVQLVAPDDWTVAQRGALAVALAVGHAIAHQQYGVLWRVDLQSGGADVGGALAAARRAFASEDTPVAAPLCEVALALVAVLG